MSRAGSVENIHRRARAAELARTRAVVLLLIAWLGVAKAALSLVGAVAIDLDSFKSWYHVAHVLLFGFAGVVLLVFGRTDRRAIALGIAFILTGTAWSDRLLMQFAVDVAWVAPIARTFALLQVAAFTPFFFWSFIRDFPHGLPYDPRAAVVNRAVAVAFGVGLALLLVNLVPLWSSGGEASALVSWFDRRELGSLFWPLTLVMSLPAIAYAVRQAGHAPLNERRRVRIVLASLILGFAPELIIVLGSAMSPAFDRMIDPQRAPIVYLIIGGPMMAVPFVIAYAVLVHRALDLRLIVRKAVQYGLARYSIVAFALLPFAAALLLAYQRRNQTLVALFEGPLGLLLAATILVGVLLLRSRHWLLTALDRRFFREQYDAHKILASLVQRSRTLNELREIAVIVPAEIDRALHVESVALFAADRASGMVKSPAHAAASLPLNAQLLRDLQNAGGLLELNLDQVRGDLSRLPSSEQTWALENDARLLIQISGRAGTFDGLLVLGDKRSELPYSTEDRQLLRTVADAVALALDNLSSHPPNPAARDVLDSVLQECVNCGRITASADSRCTACGSALAASLLSPIIAGKYRPIQRIGRGGMGVVYRAIDESLGREVAIKTLPTAAPHLTARIRREARAMAAVAHLNLETIFAVESRHGVPMLVVELLRGGTLSDRLQSGPLPIPEALSLTIDIAAGLHCLHQAGILHRDIKPANIGLTNDGTPKLLDFGVAHILGAVNPPNDTLAMLSEMGLSASSGLTSTGELVGTLPYLSPEAVQREPPTPDVDLWALSLVAYESIAGHHPFAQGGTAVQVLYRIASTPVPDIRDFVPMAPEALAQFFVRNFSSDLRTRARTAEEWRRRAVSVRGHVTALQPA